MDLTAAALTSTSRYSTTTAPVQDYTATWLARRSGMYLIKAVDPRPRRGQYVFQREDGNWYGGMRLTTGQHIVVNGDGTIVYTNNVADPLKIATTELALDGTGYGVDQIVSASIVDKDSNGKYIQRDYQNYYADIA